jgi:hypothetical protein
VEIDSKGDPKPWIKTSRADLIVASAILVNSLLLGLEVESALQNGGDPATVIFVFQVLFYLLFIAELAFRIYADGRWFFSPSNWLGLLDVLIMMLWTIEYFMMIDVDDPSGLRVLSSLRLLRLLRVVQIAHLHHFCPDLWMMTSSLASSLRAISWICLLLLLIMYVFCLMSALELGIQDCTDCSGESLDQVDVVVQSSPCCSENSLLLKDWFGSVDRSFFTHFMIFTLEDFPAVAKAAGQYSWFWYVYVALFILLCSIALVTLAMGIVVKNALQVGPEVHVEDMKRKLKEDEDFNDLFLAACLDRGLRPTDNVQSVELLQLLRSPIIREVLNSIEICLEVDANELFNIIDVNKSKHVTVQELSQQMLRLRGSKYGLHGLLVQRDLGSYHTKFLRYLEESRKGVTGYSLELAAALDTKLRERLVGLMESVTHLTLALNPSHTLSSGMKERIKDEADDDSSGDAHELAFVLSQLEAKMTASGDTLLRLRHQLEASRARIRVMETQLDRRSTSVQTVGNVFSVADQWNHDPGVVSHVASIVPQRWDPEPDLIQPLKGLSRGVDLYMDEKEREEIEAARNFLQVKILGVRNLPKLAHHEGVGISVACEIRGKQYLKTRAISPTGEVPQDEDLVWDEVCTFEDFEPGDIFDFTLMARGLSLKNDDVLAIAKVTSGQFWPHGYSGEITLNEVGPYTYGIEPILGVHVVVQGPAVIPPLELSKLKLENITQDQTALQDLEYAFWDTSPAPHDLLPRDLEYLERVRKHRKKGSALDATRSPDSSDPEESARSHRRRHPMSSATLTESLMSRSAFGSRSASPVSTSRRNFKSPASNFRTPASTKGAHRVYIH